jgi:DMSO/TMAO reductase YedYZ molybdopterin-dependent catalytic subunit
MSIIPPGRRKRRMTRGGKNAQRDKLIATKRRWADEKRLLAGTHRDPDRDRVPPGQTLTTGWPVLELGEQPLVTQQSFRLDVVGFVRRPFSLDWTGFLALPQVDSVSDMHCVTQWSRLDNHSRGVAAATLLALAEPKDEARHVLFHSSDGYTTNVRLEQFASAGAMLVHQWNGQPITREHGGPVRVLIPRLYLWKSPKWIGRIELSPNDRRGFWKTRGYHNNADPWAEERYG